MDGGPVLHWHVPMGHSCQPGTIHRCEADVSQRCVRTVSRASSFAHRFTDRCGMPLSGTNVRLHTSSTGRDSRRKRHALPGAASNVEAIVGFLPWFTLDARILLDPKPLQHGFAAHELCDQFLCTISRTICANVHTVYGHGHGTSVNKGSHVTSHVTCHLSPRPFVKCDEHGVRGGQPGSEQLLTVSSCQGRQRPV